MIFDHILGFLGNQTLVKLQSITGDFYPSSRRELSRICCACEDDNLAMVGGLCVHCEKQKDPNAEQCVSMSDARELYGIWKFTGIPRVDGGRRLTMWDVRKVFNRADLEKHMQKKCGSKIKWLRTIAAMDKKNGGLRKKVAGRIHMKAQYQAVLRSLPPKCAAYVNNASMSFFDHIGLQQRAERYSKMTTALEARGLLLRDDSKLCRGYIMNGYGIVAEIVDTMEEMGFLYDHTNYESRCSAKTSQIHKPYRPWRGWGYDSDDFGFFCNSDYDSYDSSVGDEDDYYERLQECRENTKKEVCIDYLYNDKGLTLPRKWEACRERYDYTVSVGAKPALYRQYIYTGQGGQPRRQTSGSKKRGKGKRSTTKG